MSDSLHRPSRSLTMTVLGSAGSSRELDPEHPSSGYLLSSSGCAVLLDCGFGTFASYHSLASENALDAVVVSHAHADHAADLEAFLNDRSLWRDQPRLIASAATVTALLGESIPSLVDLMVVDDGALVHVGTCDLTFSSTTHQVPTLAVLAAFGDVRVAYSADTGPDWLVPPNFRGCDIAIIECTLDERSEDSSPFHLDSREMAEIAITLSPSETVVTHVPLGDSGERRLDLVRKVAPGRRFTLASAGKTFVAPANDEDDL